MGHASELVSIGLPVYNAERYVASALGSLLAQDYHDLELVISDNASTDATPEICRQYARRDERITFRRNETNIGAARNFTQVFQLSRGKYFMWAAHDDLWHPTYIRRCVQALRQNADVVLCSSDILFIGEDGEPESYDRFNRLHTHSLSLRQRVRALTERMGWFSIYGVLRPEVLRKTRLYTEAFGGDVILLMELLFQGTTLILPEPLFSYRLIRRSGADYLATITGSSKHVGEFTPYTNLARSLLHVIESSNCTAADKAQMREDLLQNVCRENQQWRRLIVNEHPSLSQVPGYQQPVEVRALLAPEMTTDELNLLRKAAYTSYVSEWSVGRRTVFRIRRFLHRYVLRRLRRLS